MSENNVEYSGLPQTKDELLHRIEKEWQKLEIAVSSLRHERMEIPDSGGWSVKDNLAHLAEWERFLRLHHMRGLLPHEVVGIDPKTFEKIDENDLNAILFERNKRRSIEDVVKGLHESHAQVMLELDKLPFEDMMQLVHTEDEDPKSILYWIAGNTYEHYREHRQSIEKFSNRKLSA